MKPRIAKHNNSLEMLRDVATDAHSETKNEEAADKRGRECSYSEKDIAISPIGTVRIEFQRSSNVYPFSA